MSPWAALGCALVFGCAPVQSTGPARTVQACRMVERGIGGTGSPIMSAERGIGGTGAPVMTAERGIGGTGIGGTGIGGTGIVGVITGFGSVCLNGLEVALSDQVPVTVDDLSAQGDALRAGQLALIDASGDPSSLAARRVAVRHEVIGPIEALLDGGSAILVAGQPVGLGRGPAGDASLAIGQWVAVSGLRRADGAVEATRIDAAAPGAALLRGRVEQAGGVAHIGRAQLRLPAGASGIRGTIVARGRYGNGTLDVTGVAPDPAAYDAVAAFGADVSRFVLESHVAGPPDRLTLADGPTVDASAFTLPDSGYAVVTLSRDRSGFHVIGLTAAPLAMPSLGHTLGEGDILPGLLSLPGSRPPGPDGRGATPDNPGRGPHTMPPPGAAIGPTSAPPINSGPSGGAPR